MRQCVTQAEIVGVVVMCVVAVCSGAAQAEKKKIQLTADKHETLSWTEVTIGDVPNHAMVQHSVIHTYATISDPDFDAMRARYYIQSDTIGGTGTHRGYYTNYHKSGDKTYLQFEGTHTTVPTGGGRWTVNIQGTSQFTGGTGKFTNIKGTEVYSGTYSKQRFFWEAVYEVEY